MIRNRLMMGLTIAAALACAGCIFEPRDANPPSGEDEYPWVVPNLPTDVFHNLETGFTSNVDSNYDRSLDASFMFHPTDQDSMNFPDKFGDWTKTVELEWLGTVKTTYVNLRSMRFGDEDGKFRIANVVGDAALYEGDYEMILRATASSVADTFAGSATFRLVRRTQGWVMVEWTDQSTIGEYSTSGFLRGQLRATK